MISVNSWLISTMDQQAGVKAVLSTAAANWPTANLACYVAFYLTVTLTINRFVIANSTAVAGNFDIGIYNWTTKVKIISTGSTAQAGASTIQVVAIANTQLTPGYYAFGIAKDTNTGRINRQTLNNVNESNIRGCSQEATAFPLPATATPVAQAGTFFLPYVGAYTTKMA